MRSAQRSLHRPDRCWCSPVPAAARRVCSCTAWPGWSKPRAPRRTASSQSPSPTKPRARCASAPKRCSACRAQRSGSAPSTASPTACCDCTGAKQACPRPSRSSTPTTSCGSSKNCSRRSSSMRPAGYRATSSTSSISRRTRAFGRKRSRTATIRRAASSSSSTRTTKTPAASPVWSTSPSCCCVPSNCGATNRNCSRITAAASVMCWSMSSRTPTPFSTPGRSCWSAPPVRPLRWAMTTNRSIVGAARGSRTYRPSATTSRRSRWCGSSRTTARPATSSTPPTR